MNSDLRHFPRCDVRDLVHLAGELIVSLWLRMPGDEKLPLAGIVRRCRGQARYRFETLHTLCEALANAGGRCYARRDPRCWRHIEHGMGT